MRLVTLRLTKLNNDATVILVAQKVHISKSPKMKKKSHNYLLCQERLFLILIVILFKYKLMSQPLTP